MTTRPIAGDPVVVAGDLGFPEGPTALGDGSIAVVEMQGQRLTRVLGDGSRQVLADLGGGPNGSTLGPDGALYVANNGGLSMRVDGQGYWWAAAPIDGCVQRVGADGTPRVYHAAALPGPAPHRPNDLCTGPDGALYVTDSGNWEDMKNLREGAIVRIGADGDVTTFAMLAAMPNGIVATPDGERLLVAQSLTRRIWSFPIAGGEPVELTRLAAGIPDGMALAADGRLFVCTSVGHAVSVHAPSGDVVGVIETGAGTQPTNCCLEDGLLYVTLALTGQLVRFDVDAAPAAGFGARWCGL